MSLTNASPTLVMNERVKSLWKDGKNILHLGFGESRFPVHPALKNALADGASNRSYLPATGTGKLKKIIAEYYSKKLSATFSPDQILVGVGSKSLLYSIIHSLEGDLLLPKPSWVSYASIAKLSGKQFTRFDLDRENQYQIDFNLLQDTYVTARDEGQNPKMIVVNSPNNPVGNSYSQTIIESISDWACEKEIVILSDEIYSLLTHSSTTHSSPSTYYPEKTIIFGGLSKHLSLGGYRIGFAILPLNGFGAEITTAFNSIAGSIWSCVPAPIQVMAQTAFGESDDIESYIKTCTDIHQVRTHYVFDALQKMGIASPTPTGGFYIYISMKKHTDSLAQIGINSCNDLADYLLNTCEIATLPGIAFGDDPEECCLRLSTSYLDMETDEKAQHILDTYNTGIDHASFMKDHHPRINLFLNRMEEFVSSLN